MAVFSNMFDNMGKYLKKKFDQITQAISLESKNAKKQKADPDKGLIPANYWRTLDQKRRPAIGNPGTGVFVPPYKVTKKHALWWYDKASLNPDNTLPIQSNRPSSDFIRLTQTDVRDLRQPMTEERRKSMRSKLTAFIQRILKRS